MIAYCAKDLATGKMLSANAAVVMPSWSTIKLLLAAAFWRAVERGELKEAYPFAFQPWASVGGAGVLHGFKYAVKLTLADCVHLSLAVSDNDATNIVASFVKLDRVNALADELDLPATRMRRRMMDLTARERGVDNTTSATDMVRLLEELAMGPRLSAAVRDPILTSLAKTEHLDGVARYLPPDAVYMGKTGDDQPDGTYTHDCCLIGRGNRLVAMAILTDGHEGYEAVSRLGSALFAAVSGDAEGVDSSVFSADGVPSGPAD